MPICQVADVSVRTTLPCPATESGGYQCEVHGLHDQHRIGEHTIQHALAGNGYACSAIGWAEQTTEAQLKELAS